VPLGVNLSDWLGVDAQRTLMHLFPLVKAAYADAAGTASLKTCIFASTRNFASAAFVVTRIAAARADSAGAAFMVAAVLAATGNLTGSAFVIA
jgi:hypothetical protein